MGVLLVPVDAEQAFIDELGGAIGTGIPDPLPSSFLRVISAGGFQRDLVTDSFTITLEAFAKTEGAARELLVTSIAKAQAAIEAGRLGNEVAYRLNVAALPQNFPHPNLRTHKRYISTLVPDLRRRAITL